MLASFMGTIIVILSKPKSGVRMKFDVWEFPQKCVGCGGQDNNDRDHPTSYLDCPTKLCELCFMEKYCETDDES